MGSFVFRSAVPFGYLGFWVGVVVLEIIALALVVGGLRSARKGTAISGGLLLTGLIVVTVVNVIYDKNLDTNPMIHGRQELAGSWKDGAATLELRLDGTFACQGGNECSELRGAGAWAWNDFEITFRPATGPEVVRRIVRYDDELRLANVPGDLDAWDGRFSFRLTRSAG
jgi:hypothetical protein